MARFLLLNGPNLNLLGQREPEVYGSDTLASIEERAKNAAAKLGHELVDLPEQCRTRAHRPGADRARPTASASPSSTRAASRIPAWRCATRLLGVKLPFIELHLSNTFAREKFRHHSYFSDIAVGCIVGLGALGYELAIQAAAARPSHGRASRALKVIKEGSHLGHPQSQEADRTTRRIGYRGNRDQGRRRSRAYQPHAHRRPSSHMQPAMMQAPATAAAPVAAAPRRRRSRARRARAPRQ